MVFNHSCPCFLLFWARVLVKLYVDLSPRSDFGTMDMLEQRPQIVSTLNFFTYFLNKVNQQLVNSCIYAQKTDPNPLHDTNH